MGKKLLVLLLALLAVFSFVSCEPEPEVEEHVHEYVLDTTSGTIKCTGEDCEDAVLKGSVFAVVDTDNGLAVTVTKVPEGSILDFKTDEKGTFVIQAEANDDVIVNAPNADVYLFGAAKTVTIKAVKDSTAHLYAKVKDLSIEKGRLVADANSTVETIAVKGAETKVELKTTAPVKAIEVEAGTVEVAEGVKVEAIELAAGEVKLAKGAVVAEIALPADATKETAKITVADVEETVLPTVKKGTEEVTDLTKVLTGKTDEVKVPTKQVAKIGSKVYETLEAAVTAAVKDDTITLLSDVEAPSKTTALKFAEGVTLDLNKHTIKNGYFGKDKAYYFQGTSLTLKNGTFEGIATDETGYFYGIYVGFDDNKYTENVTLEDLKFKNGGINVAHAKNVVVDNCEVTMDDTNKYYSIVVQDDKASSSATVKSGKFVRGTNNNVAYVTNGTLTIEGGSFDGNFLFGTEGKLEVKGGSFTDLETAVKYAKEGTITLLKDAEGPGIFVGSKDAKNITIDLNGKTYTCVGPAVGSEGTKSQAFHLEKGNTITIKSGILNTSKEKGIKMLIQNYCDLTIDGVTVDGTNLDSSNSQYVFSNNCGTVAVKNSKIKATEEFFAMDSCKYKTYDAPTVTVSGDSIINGSVEVSGGNLHIESGTLKGILSMSSGKTTLSGGKYVCDNNSTVKVSGGNLEITGGEFEAQECCVALFGAADNTTIINGGKFTSNDNFVVGNNGLSTYTAHSTNLTINGGEFNGNISTAGYIACGIYWCNEGELTVNGGKFTITNGSVLVLRSGTLKAFTIDGSSTFTGSSEGKVGDKIYNMNAAKRIIVDATTPLYPAGAPVCSIPLTNDDVKLETK